MLKVYLDDHQLKSLWFSIKENIANGVPDTPSDEGFLMSLLSEVAKPRKVIKGKSKNRGKYKVEMSFVEMRGCWFCLRVATDNGFFKNEGQVGIGLKTMSTLAEALDTYLISEAEVEPSSESKSQELNP